MQGKEKDLKPFKQNLDSNLDSNVKKQIIFSEMIIGQPERQSEILVATGEDYSALQQYYREQDKQKDYAYIGRMKIHRRPYPMPGRNTIINKVSKFAGKEIKMIKFEDIKDALEQGRFDYETGDIKKAD